MNAHEEKTEHKKIDLVLGFILSMIYSSILAIVCFILLIGLIGLGNYAESVLEGEKRAVETFVFALVIITLSLMLYPFVYRHVKEDF